MRLEFSAHRGDVIVGPLKARPQALELQRLDLVARGPFNRGGGARLLPGRHGVRSLRKLFLERGYADFWARSIAGRRAGVETKTPALQGRQAHTLFKRTTAWAFIAFPAKAGKVAEGRMGCGGRPRSSRIPVASAFAQTIKATARRLMKTFGVTALAFHTSSGLRPPSPPSGEGQPSVGAKTYFRLPIGGYSRCGAPV